MATRRILLVSHPGRPEVVAALADVSARLQAAGIDVLVSDGSAPGTVWPEWTRSVSSASSVETGPSFGAEGRPGARRPALGSTTGHVGFLAEVEQHTDLHETVDRVVARDYATGSG